MILDRGGESPYRTVGWSGGKPHALTGWCKTLSYCEKQAHDAGGILVETVALGDLTEDERAQLRITPWAMGDLKSALQKAIRRSHVQLSADLAYTIAGDGGGLWWLGMRAPIFCVEDVGWDWLSRLPKTRLSEDMAVNLAVQLAASAKSREAGDLHAVASTRSENDESMEGRCAYLLARYEEEGVDAAEWRLVGTTEHARHAVDKALWRARQGKGDDARMLVTGAFLACEGGTGWSPPMWEERAVTPRTVGEIPWWALDGHSTTGGKALTKLAKRLKVKRNWLNMVWFFAESLRVDPRRSRRWVREADDLWARELGFDHADEMHRWWETVRDDAREAVEKEMP